MRRATLGLALLTLFVLAPPASAWTWPLHGDVLRPYSLGPDPYAAGQHRGVDVGGAAGEPVRAPASGTVSFAGVVPGSGRTVTIQFDGYAVSLTHLGEITVAKGAAVTEGEPVGLAGANGDAEWPTPYVHLGIRVSAAADGYLDPATLLPPRTCCRPRRRRRARTGARAVAGRGHHPPHRHAAAGRDADAWSGLAVGHAGTGRSVRPCACDTGSGRRRRTPAGQRGHRPGVGRGSARDTGAGTRIDDRCRSVRAVGSVAAPSRVAPRMRRVNGRRGSGRAAASAGSGRHRPVAPTGSGQATARSRRDAASRLVAGRAAAAAVAASATAGCASPVGAADVRGLRVSVAAAARRSTAAAADSSTDDSSNPLRRGAEPAGAGAVGTDRMRATALRSACRRCGRHGSCADASWLRAGSHSSSVSLSPRPSPAQGGRLRASVESIGMERFYVTTPIYYVNSTPHIGHAYTTIAADILVRHRRQRGDETFFLTGVDEHAAKVARVAAEQGLSPQAYADQIAGVWRELPERLNASNDFFIRTSDRRAQGLRPGVPAAPLRQRSRLSGRLRRALLRRVRGVQDRGRARRREVPRARRRARVDRGEELVLPALRLPGAAAGAVRARRLRAARLPRERGAELHQGRPAGLLDQPRRPDVGDPDPVGSGFGRLRLGRRSRQLPERADVRPAGHRPRRHVLAEVRHLLAKDILRFHCVYWPAMLLGAGYDPPKQLFVHGYLLLDDRKISKSLGNVVDPLDLVDVYGVDPVRFWCARAISFGQDGTASIEGIQERYERELGNDLGNLVSRTTAMVARYRDGRVRAVQSPDGAVAAALGPLAGDVAERLDRFDVTGALERIWEVVRGAQPRGRVGGAVAARQGRRARGRARPRPLRPRRRPPRRRDHAGRLRAGDVRRDPRGAAPAARARLVARGLRAVGRDGGDRARRAAVPAARASGRVSAGSAP